MITTSALVNNTHHLTVIIFFFVMRALGSTLCDPSVDAAFVYKTTDQDLLTEQVFAELLCAPGTSLGVGMSPPLSWTVQLGLSTSEECQRKKAFQNGN